MPSLPAFIPLFLLATTLFGQTPSPAFEVASVKVAAPSDRPSFIMKGGPGTTRGSDPGQFTCLNVPLQTLVVRAYGLQLYQLITAHSLENDHYDIVAKIPPGATEAQFQVMLQNLLAERIGLVVHRESRELQTYAMVVAKGGLKLKPAEVADAGVEARATVQAKDGSTRLAPGTHTRMITMVDGHPHISARGQALPDLLSMMTNRIGHPVEDKTGLTGVYDFELDFSMDAGPGAAPTAGGDDLVAASDPAPTFIEAIQQQLGLKLEQRKGPVDVVVVERWNKVPTGN